MSALLNLLVTEDHGTSPSFTGCSSAIPPNTLRRHRGHCMEIQGSRFWEVPGANSSGEEVFARAGWWAAGAWRPVLEVECLFTVLSLLWWHFLGWPGSCSKGSPRREHRVAKPMRLTQTLPTERALAFYQLVHGTDLCTMKGRLATHK